MTTIPITVPFDGRPVTLMELGRITGLKYETLSARYHKGDRGERLIRPLEVNGPATIETEQNEDLKHRRRVLEFTRIKEAERAAQQRQRELDRRELRARAAAAVAATAQPLITGELLTDAERKIIRERVRLSGQRSWRRDGGGWL